MPPSIRTVCSEIALVAGLVSSMESSVPVCPFSILYFAPVIACAWYGNRVHGLIVAGVAVAARLSGDIH